MKLYALMKADDDGAEVVFNAAFRGLDGDNKAGMIHDWIFILVHALKKEAEALGDDVMARACADTIEAVCAMDRLH